MMVQTDCILGGNVDMLANNVLYLEGVIVVRLLPILQMRDIRLVDQRCTLARIVSFCLPHA